MGNVEKSDGGSGRGGMYEPARQVGCHAPGASRF